MSIRVFIIVKENLNFLKPKSENIFVVVSKKKKGISGDDDNTSGIDKILLNRKEDQNYDNFRMLYSYLHSIHLQ